MPEYTGRIRKFIDEKKQAQIGDIVFTFSPDLYRNFREHFERLEMVQVEVVNGVVKNIVSRQYDDQ